jgi:hypothetical protein
MSKEAFIRFMITQSNVIAQVEENGQKLARYLIHILQEKKFL